MRAPSLLLALESALRTPGIALLRDGELVAEITLPPTRPVSEQLLPGIDALLTLCGSPLDAVDAFAVSIGPGSFTGIRVGVATLKGLAFGGAQPVAAVSTLAALACAAGIPGDTVAAIIDARRGEVYAGVYELTEGEPSVTLADGLYTVEEKIKRGPDRVDIVKLEPQATTAPAITGGYMLKIDRSDPNEATFYDPYLQGSIVYVDPPNEPR